MRDFDEQIKTLAAEEKREIPACVTERIDSTLEALEEPPKKKSSWLVLKRVVAAAACIAVTFLFVLPNVSPAYAASLENVPVLNKIIRVMTIRNYFYSDAQHDLDVQVPHIEENQQAADYINKDVDELTQLLVHQFYKDLELDGGNGHGSIHLDYETVTNAEEWFTLRLTIEEIAASSNRYYKYYHIDKKNGKIAQLGDLFIDASYQTRFAEEIKQQMQNRMQEDPDTIYWYEKSEFGEDFVTIHENQNFYWDKDGNIVICFDKYEVGPGASGTPEFTISKELFAPLLKAEYKK